MSDASATPDAAHDAAPATPGEEPLEAAPHGPLPVGSTRRSWARRPADEAEAKAMSSPLRLRILRTTLHEARTNKEIAETLGINPATALHHVRTLVDTGFLIEQELRRGARGSRERPYLASGKSWSLDTGDSERDVAAADDLLLRTFLEEVATLPPGSLDSVRLGFRVDAATKERIESRIHDLMAEIAALPSDPAGEAWSLYLGVHRDPSGVRSSHDEHA